MKVKPGSTNLILVGKWNKYILSPNWLAKNIFKNDNIQVEFSFNLDLPPRFTCDKIRIVATEDNVVFVALTYDEDIISRIEEMVYNLAESLPHTPVSAFGTNFVYIEDGATEDLASLFELKDNNDLSDYNVRIEEYSIKRKLIINEQVLNLNISQNRRNVVFDLNFHYETPSTDKIKEKIRNRFVENKKIAENMLKEVYRLELDEPEEGNE